MSIARDDGTIRIYTEDTPRRHAPVNERGILGWVRHNLFRTPLDAILTLISAYVIYAVISSAVTWAVGSANWFAITRNLSLFMLGPLQADRLAVNNVQIMTLILAFAVGISLAAWSRVSLRGWIVIAAIAASTLLAPGAISAALPMPTSIISAGNAPITSGSLVETPRPSVAFIAMAGETVTIRLAPAGAGDDVRLVDVAAFTDRATDAALNAARERSASLARLDEINARLMDPGLTDAERQQLESQAAQLAASTETPITERLAINTTPVTVRLLSADQETVLLSAELTQDSAPLTAEIPQTGWYVLEKTAEGETIALLETTGIYPHFERQFSQPLVNADGEPVRNANGSQRMQSVTQYLRMTDDLLVTAAPPRIDGTDVPRYSIVDNQYRGERPVVDFLVLHVGPFLAALSRLLVPVTVAVIGGYAAGVLLNRLVHPPVPTAEQVLHPKDMPVYSAPTGLRRFVPRWVFERWYWIAAVAVVFAVLRFATDFGRATDFFGVAAVALLLTGLGFVSFMMLKPVPGTLYARRVVSWLWFIMPFIVFALMAGTDLGRWGGLFLTFMLTIVGIVASFPIGVLLALGRRADNLPAIKYLCITFIEVVRGVPLITVLFLASLALPLVSPSLDTVPQAIRAMVAITLFSAAYLAENVRGGLQSVPHGQSEAARALGMNPVQVTVFITLPQALRAVIPALVGQCIALFKDTSLVAIVGLLDLTKTADSVVAQAEYIGLRREVYIFISVIYFIFSYAMGYVSRKIEQSGSGAARQTEL